VSQREKSISNCAVDEKQECFHIVIILYSKDRKLMFVYINVLRISSMP